jgi:hypothetical protein
MLSAKDYPVNPENLVYPVNRITGFTGLTRCGSIRFDN